MQEAGNYNFEQQYTSSNQLSGWSYDQAGNLVTDGLGNNYQYNAEGKIKNGAGATYTYTAEGDRVEKAGSTTVDTVYFGGRPIARVLGGAWTDLVYGPTGILAEVPGTQAGAPVYRMTDHLGSVVGTLSSAGSVISTVDLGPFGEVFAGGSSDPYIFTGKERDAESGNDNFGARYYSNNIGRFMTPDWASGAEAVPYSDYGDPQSLNLYAYVRNNPISHTDADGHASSQGTPNGWWNHDTFLDFVRDSMNGGRRQTGGAALLASPLAQQQNYSSGGKGFWSHVGNLLHGHSWNYVQTSVTTTETYTVSEPNSHVDLATSAAGLLSATPGAVPGAPGVMLGLAAGGVSSINDPSALNLGINATGGALGVISYFAEGTAVGAGATVGGFGVAVGATGLSASNWISTNVITPVFTPDANQSSTINANGVTIQAPDAFDWSQP